MSLEQRYDDLRDAWTAGAVTLPILVLAAEEIVNERSDALGENVAQRATRTWGQIEIINALTLDSGGGLSREDINDVSELLGALRAILFGGRA